MQNLPQHNQWSSTGFSFSSYRESYPKRPQKAVNAENNSKARESFLVDKKIDLSKLVNITRISKQCTSFTILYK